MSRRKWIVFTFVLATLMNSPGLMSDDKSDQEKAVVKSFNQFAADLIASFKAEKHEIVESDRYVSCVSMRNNGDIIFPTGDGPPEAKKRQKPSDVSAANSLWFSAHVMDTRFRRSRYEPSVDYGIDVRKTDSLISPYLGVVEFHWIGYRTDCAKTKEEAQAKGLPTEENLLVKYRYTYAFQDGAWVRQKREVYYSEWKDCKKSEFDFGCSVPEKTQATKEKTTK